MIYEVRVTTNYNTGDYDAFVITANDLLDAQAKAINEAIERGYNHEDLEGVYEVENHPQIKRESTWDYDTYDENGLFDGGTDTVETIETWDWNEKLDRYELVCLEEKETGKYIPYNEKDYIRDGAVEIPQQIRDDHKGIDDVLHDYMKIDGLRRIRDNCFNPRDIRFRAMEILKNME